jgi:hypothetical protein
MATQEGPPAWTTDIVAGTFDARVLDQGSYWVTAEGGVLLLASMATAHLSAVIRYLRARALLLHQSAMVGALVSLIEARAVGQTTAEQLTHDLTGQSIASITPEAWLEATPLMRALRRQLAARR